MGAYPFTKLLWQRYFRPHQNPATVTASTFSISRKGTKNSRFSCSTCPEAPATLSSAPDLSFLIGKTARRRVSRSNQIKISASMRAPGMATRLEVGETGRAPVATSLPGESSTTSSAAH